MKSATDANATQATELQALHEAASASAACIQSAQQELQSRDAQLQRSASQISQMAVEHEQLLQEHDQQLTRCAQLEAELSSSGAAVSRLQGCLQIETEALCSVREELLGEDGSMHV